MRRTPSTNWRCLPLAALLFGCGRTELSEGLGFEGFGGTAGGTLVTNGVASVGGQGQGSESSASFGSANSIGSSSASTNSASTVSATSATTGNGGAAGQSSWDGPVLVETEEPGSTWGARIAMNDDGVAVVAILQNLTDGSAVWAVPYTPDDGWSDAELIATDGAQLPDARVAIDDEGSSVVAWPKSEPAANLWSRRRGVGSGWEAPEVVNPEAVLQGHSIGVALDAQGTTLAVWRESDGTNSHLWSNRHTPGAGWGSAVAIQETTNPFDVYFAMNPSGNAIAIWSQGDGEPGIWSSRSEVGVDWTLPEAIHGGSSDGSQSPDVAVDAGGNGVAVWNQRTDSGSTVWANRFVAGVGWAGAEIINTAAPAAEEASIGMDGDGSAIALWLESDGTAVRAWSNRYTLDSGWGEAEPISNAAGAFWRPALTVGSAGDAVAVWTQFHDDGGIAVWSNRYLPGAGWLEPEFIDIATPGTSGGVDVGIDGAGNAIAVWSNSDGGPSQLWANHSSRPE